MSQNPKKILVALDGSDQSMEAARYVSNVLSLQPIELVLFHVLNKIPEAYWDLEKHPGYKGKAFKAHVWEIQHKKDIEAFMERTRSMILDAGIPRDAVTIVLHDRKVGVARDIILPLASGLVLA